MKTSRHLVGALLVAARKLTGTNVSLTLKSTIVKKC